MGGGAAALAAGLPLEGTAVGAPPAPRHLITLYVYGAWDTTYVLDPKPGLSTVDAPDGQVTEFGDLRIFTAPTRWGKNTWTDEKWSDPQEGDKKRLQDYYLNHGYVTASIGEPTITYVDGKSGFLKKKPVKWAHVEIPVNEGERYRVGEIKFDGMTVFKPEGIRSMLKLQEGDWYRESRVEKLVDKLRDAYGAQGYFQWTVGIDRKPDREKKTVDVTLKMDEDKRYFVGKIRFTGNDTTRDKVIRREVYLNEGDVFNTEALKLSIRRINQLGYFKPMEQPPAIQPSTVGEDRLDLVFKVEEQNRNQFTFGGGVSGLEGTFINASFSTANFLGLGETFQISAQSGRRTKNYQIAITEPYLFDRPITAGFDIFKRKLVYETFTNAVARPSRATGEKYNQVSSEFFNAVHTVLSGETDAASSLAALESKLDRLSRGGRW